MKTLKNTLGVAFTSLALMVGFTPSANALIVEISSGADVVTVADGDLNDVNPLAGVVTAVAVNVGDFLTTVSTGTSKPASGTAEMGFLDLSSVETTSGVAGGAVQIRLTETGFVSTAAATSFLSAVGGTLNAGGTATFDFYVDDADIAFGTSTLIYHDVFNPVAFSGELLSSAALTDTFSMTIVANILHTGAGTSSFDASIEVPEPHTIALMGLGLLGMGFARRRRS